MCENGSWRLPIFLVLYFLLDREYWLFFVVFFGYFQTLGTAHGPWQRATNMFISMFTGHSAHQIQQWFFHKFHLFHKFIYGNLAMTCSSKWQGLVDFTWCCPLLIREGEIGIWDLGGHRSDWTETICRLYSVRLTSSIQSVQCWFSIKLNSTLL